MAKSLAQTHEHATGRVHPSVLAAGVVVALGLTLIVALAPFIPGLIGAPVLAVLFTPLFRALARRTRASVAAGLALVAAVALLLIPGVAIVSLLVRDVPTALSGSDFPQLFARLSALTIHGVPVGSQLAAVGTSIVAWASRQMFVVAGSATRAAVNLLIAFFGLYYLLVSGDAAWRSFSNYSPFSRATTERLRLRFRDVTKATLLGIGLGSAVQALVIGSGFALTGLPNPVLWGAVAGVAAVLPVLGASLIWGSGTIVLAAQGRSVAAVVLLLIGAVISAHVENFIRPIVSRRVSRLHPLITLVGAFAGIRYVGLPGLLLGPLALAYFFELLRAFELEFLGRPEPAGDDAG